MKGISSLAHVALKVKDMDRSLDFYVGKMGFPEMFRLHRDGKLWIVYLRITDDQYLELFPDGADFLKLPYAKQWAECDKRITIVQERALQPDIDRLAGAAFWKQIESLHQRYGEVLGITKSKQPAPEPAKLLEPLRLVQRAISNYVIQVAAWAAQDASAIPQATLALAPVDAAREGIARRASGAAAVPAVTPETPLPPEATA